MIITSRTSQTLAAVALGFASTLAARAANTSTPTTPLVHSGRQTPQTSAEAAEVTALMSGLHRLPRRRTTTMTATAQSHARDRRRLPPRSAPIPSRRHWPQATNHRRLPAGTTTTNTTPTAKHEKPEPESQTVSDAQLRQAQGVVQQVRNGIQPATQPKVAAHLDEAIKEIGLATGRQINTKKNSPIRVPQESTPIFAFATGCSARAAVTWVP